MLANSFISALFFGLLLMLSGYDNLDKEPSGYERCQEFLARRAAAYEDGATFGTKTAYLFDAPRPRNETTLAGCTAVQVSRCVFSNFISLTFLSPLNPLHRAVRVNVLCKTPTKVFGNKV